MLKITPDFCLEEDLIIHAGKTQIVGISDLEQKTNNFDVSTRSHLARVGLSITRILDGKAEIHNFGRSSISLGKGYSIGRLYTAHDSLNERQLEEILPHIISGSTQDTIQIGKDEESESNAYIEMKLDQDNIQITREGAEVKIRKKDDYIGALIKGNNSINQNNLLRVSKTLSEVSLPRNIGLIVDTRPLGDGTFHINSPLIDPGFQGSIVTEFYGLQNPEFVRLFAYETH